MATTNTLVDSSSQGTKESPEARTADYFSEVHVIFGRETEMAEKISHNSKTEFGVFSKVLSFLESDFRSG